MNKRELGLARNKNDREYSACEYLSSLTDIVLNSIKLMKREASRLYSGPCGQYELGKSLHIIEGDMLSIKSQIEDKASEIADERVELWKEEE